MYLLNDEQCRLIPLNSEPRAVPNKAVPIISLLSVTQATLQHTIYFEIQEEPPKTDIPLSNHSGYLQNLVAPVNLVVTAKCEVDENRQ